MSYFSPLSLHAAFLLSCSFPRSPDKGGVTVTDIHPGGQAHFYCDPGFQVRGHEVATCVNTTQPHWSTPEPQCVGECERRSCVTGRRVPALLVKVTGVGGVV